MKIGMIVRRLNVKGGTQRQMLSLARELKRRGHEIKIFTFALDRERCYPELLEGLDIVVREEGNSEGWDYYLDFRFLKGQLGSILRETRRAKQLALAMDRDFDILNPHDQVSYKVAHYYKRCVRRIPSVWNMNDLPLYRFGYDKMREVDPNFRRSFLRRFVYRLADTYDASFIRKQDRIAVVDFWNRELVKKYLELPATTVRNGPDLEHFSYKKRTPPTGPNVKLLTSGIFLPHRRYEDAIRAVKILTDSGLNPTLTIIGDYENDKKYYESVKALIEALGVASRVRIAGRVSEAELVDAYHSHDIYLFPHHWQSDGLSPFEAAATGLPILVSETAGSHELLSDRENGMVLKAKNPEDIATKIRELVENPALYTKLSENGNKFVRENFSWEKYADQMLVVFASAMGSAR
ncbi:MAG: glycosyltransferase family 4 protein [Patescibacteria group bacterium]